MHASFGKRILRRSYRCALRTDGLRSSALARSRHVRTGIAKGFERITQILSGDVSHSTAFIPEILVSVTCADLSRGLSGALIQLQLNEFHAAAVGVTQERWKGGSAHDHAVVRVPSCATSPPATYTYVPLCSQEHFAGHIYSEMRPMPTMKQHVCLFLLLYCSSAWRSRTAYSACRSTKHLLSIPNLLGAARHRLYYRFYNFKDAIPSLPGCQPPRSGQ